MKKAPIFESFFDLLLELMYPVIGILDFAPLNSCENVIELLSYLTDFLVIDNVFNIIVHESADRRYNCGSSTAPRLLELTILHSV